jgi:hypothetical protein
MMAYYGRYSSRTRGAERERPQIEAPDAESASQARQAAKAAWAEADPQGLRGRSAGWPILRWW